MKNGNVNLMFERMENDIQIGTRDYGSIMPKTKLLRIAMVFKESYYSLHLSVKLALILPIERIFGVFRLLK